MSEVGQERKILPPITEDRVIEASERLTANYSNVFWLVDFEGVLLPKSFSGLEKRKIAPHHEDDITATERSIYRLPVNKVLVGILERLLQRNAERNWLVEGSSLVSIPDAEIQRHVPAFRFGVQRSREILADIAEKTVGHNRSLKPGVSMPPGSLMIVLNDEMPPLGLYRYVKGKTLANYDSFDMCEVSLDVYRGQQDLGFRQNTLDAMFKAFNSPVVKRPVEAPATTVWSTGSGLASMAPRGLRIRRPGD